MDATKMNYRDNTFDVCVDKGTFDALACGEDKTVIRDLTREMLRVASHSVCIITSGTPEKRLGYFKDFLGDSYDRIEYHRIEVSSMAQLINLMRTDLKDKPLSYAVKQDPEVLKRAMKELARIQ